MNAFNLSSDSVQEKISEDISQKYKISVRNLLISLKKNATDFDSCVYMPRNDRTILNTITIIDKLIILPL